MNIRFFIWKFSFLVVKFSVYMNRHAYTGISLLLLVVPCLTSPFRTIFLAYTQRQSTHKRCQYFDLTKGWCCGYSWLSLSLTRLSRITAYLEVKILSLSKHENRTASKKDCGKEEKLLLRSNFSSFPQYFRYSSIFKSPIIYKFVKCSCSNYFFLNSKNLMCRGTDISKCFRQSLGIRDNESWLYFKSARCLYWVPVT